MKVYNGWVLEINGNEEKVVGSMKIRGVQSYILLNLDSKKKSSIKRVNFLNAYNLKEIKYIRSEAA